MSGVISVRFTKEERQQLRALRSQRGFASTSALVRQALGFPPGRQDQGTAAFEEEVEELENLDQVFKLLVRIVDRLDEMYTQECKIGVRLGIQRPHPVTAVAAPHQRTTMEMVDRRREMGALDPGVELAEGFAR